MIQSIEIKNFKSIKSKYFPLRNLNVVLGINGQGKSSFIQSLLLLRQSEKLNEGILRLNGGDNGLVNIGTARDTLYQYSENDENLSFAIQFKGKEPYSTEFSYEADSDIFKQKNVITDYFVKNQNEGLFTNKFQYLNAQRIEPKKTNIGSYSSVMEANDLGKYGQYTAHYIELRGTEEVVFSNVLHKNTEKYSFQGKEYLKRALVDQINYWLGEISPGVIVKVTRVTPELFFLEYEFKQANRTNTNPFKPENVGFGISYALHVVTALLKAKQGDLLIIENPESHIHPKGQAELGKLITLVAQNDVQVIIETHSDHIINGIRVGVKENPEMKDRTILFHFEKIVADTEQYSKVTNIEIDSKGELSEYPENLLEEWSNQLLKLL